MVLPERIPSSPEPKKTVRRDLKIVPDIPLEEKITKERDEKIEKKSTKGGGGKRRVVKIIAGAGIPLVASAAIAFGLEKAGVIDIIPNEQEPSGDHLTEDKDGNVTAVIGNQENRKETSAVTEEKQEENTNTDAEVNNQVVSVREIPPEEEVLEEVDAPEIKGSTFNFVFDQESKNYFDEKTGVEIGTWVENAVIINGEMTSVIAFKPEAINKILEENKEKVVFKCPWPIDFKENKEKGIKIEIVELSWSPLYEQEIYKKHGIYIPSSIGISYTEPINFYAPFNVNNKAPKVVGEMLPDNEEDPDFFSSQGFMNLVLFSTLGYKSEEAESESYGSIQFSFLNWKPLVTLGESYELGNDGYGQNIISEIKTGDSLGEILPNISDFNFLDFTNNSKFFENPGKFQGRLLVTGFSDDFSETTSSLKKMLTYLNKAGQEIPVCVWFEENNTVHE